MEKFFFMFLENLIVSTEENTIIFIHHIKEKYKNSSASFSEKFN